MKKTCKICGKELKRGAVYCSNSCKFKDKEYNNKRGIKKYKNNNTQILKCMDCNWQSRDIYNVSGAKTRHIKKTNHINFIIENILQIDENIKLFKCPYCGLWKKSFINNIAGSLTKHLKNKHNIDIIKLINEYPDYEDNITGIRYKQAKMINSNINNSVICKICNKPMGRITITHLKNIHNISMDEYRKKYPDANTCSIKILKNNSTQMKNININMKRNYKRSKAEIEIVQYLKNELKIMNVIENNRSILNNGQELDIYLPDYNIAIEYNGIPWHCEHFSGRGSYYHITKTKICNDKNIRLIHIFADEYYNNKEIVLNRLKHILNKNIDNKIYARHCNIKEIDSKTKNVFLINNHLQGSIKSKIKLGAFYNDSLVAVMTFDTVRKSLGRRQNNHHFELTRFATNGQLIIGIANKLFKYFLNNYVQKYNIEKIISYADYRWSVGKIYEHMGFIFKYLTKPNYWYIINSKRVHRFAYRKSQLKIKFPKYYDSSKTEFEIMSNIGIDRIWDCGHLLYEYNI